MILSFSSLLKKPLFKRIIPSIYKKYIFCFKKYNKQFILNNVIYDLDLRHLIDRRLYLHKGYEDELFFSLKNIIKKNNVNYFMDIGSCWGLYSLRVAGSFKNLKIIAFDPIKKNIDRLAISIKKNSFKNIKYYHTAIGSKQGRVLLSASERFSPNYEIKKKASVFKESSQLNYLDNLFKINDKTIAIKIDTEGFEFEVLKGAKKLLLNNKCYCQIEVNKKNKKNVFLFFKKINYKLISLNNYNKTDFLFSNFLYSKIKI